MSVTTEQARRFREEAGLPAEWPIEHEPALPVVGLTRRVLNVWQSCYPDKPISPDSIWHFSSWEQTIEALDQELGIFRIHPHSREYPEFHEEEKAFQHDQVRTLKQCVSSVENIYLKQFAGTSELLNKNACQSLVLDCLDEAFRRTNVSPQTTLASVISPSQGKKLENLIWQKTGLELHLTDMRVVPGDEVVDFCFSFVFAIVAAIIGILIQPSHWKLILIAAAIFPFICAGIVLLFQYPIWREPESTVEGVADAIRYRAEQRWRVFTSWDRLGEDLPEIED
ncbi:MAG: hypothetical protein QM758_00765 [Armatimonas sp.]